MKTSFAKLVHDFDWKSIPATRKQKQGFRDSRFQILAQTPSFMKSPEKSLHTGLGGVRIKCEARFRDLAKVFAHRVRGGTICHPGAQFPDLPKSLHTGLGGVRFAILKLNFQISQSLCTQG